MVFVIVNFLLLILYSKFNPIIMNLVLCMIGLDIKVYNYAWEDDTKI